MNPTKTLEKEIGSNPPPRLEPTNQPHHERKKGREFANKTNKKRNQ
jgi:hypothetical protein